MALHWRSPVLVAIAAVLAAPRVAGADDRPSVGGGAVARLDVIRVGRAEAHCPDAAALGDAIEAVAGRRAIATGGPTADVALVVAFETHGDGFRASLRAAGARSGDRVFHDTVDPSCRALAEAVAVATAILLDARASPEAAPGGAPVPPPAAMPWPPAPAAAEPAPRWGALAGRAGEAADGRPRRPPALGAPSAWGIDAAALATTALDGSGGVEVGVWGRRRLGPASIALGARLVAPSEHHFANGAVEVWALRAGVEGCLDVRASPTVVLSPCGTAVVGTVIANGERFDRTATGTLPTFALGGAALGAFGLGGGAAVLVRAGAAGAPVRPAFQVTDVGGARDGEVGEAYRAPALVAEAGAGLRFAIE